MRFNDVWKDVENGEALVGELLEKEVIVEPIIEAQNSKKKSLNLKIDVNSIGLGDHVANDVVGNLVSNKDKVIKDLMVGKKYRDLLEEERDNLIKNVALDYALMMSCSDDTPIYSIDDIMTTWGLDNEDFTMMRHEKSFIKNVRSNMMELKKTGEHLQLKGRMLIEHWLDDLAPNWLNDPMMSFSDKDKLMNTILKVSGLGVGINNGVGLSVSGGDDKNRPLINITFTT